MANSAFHVFHMSEVLSGEKHPRQRRHLDRGFEAPRNSLDVLDAAIDVSRSGSFKPEDIPFGYEILNPALAASGPQSKWDGTSNDVGNDFSGRKETRRQGPNIVARLMGLETLPDELPTVQPRNSLQGMPIYGCSKPPVGNPSMSRQSSQDAALSSWQRPPRPRHVQRAPLNVEEDRVLAPVLPFRDHPQEELLQKFKKDFEAKQQAVLAKERDRCGTSQVLEEMNRELDEKKQRVRATLDKARTALSQGVLAELKRQLNGQENFDESKEFLEAMEFLQCNEDLIFHFLQHKPHSTLSDENSNDTTPVANLKSMKKRILGGLVPASSRESKERKREGFSPRAFARLFRDPRKRSDNKQQPCTPPLSGTTTPSSASLQPAIERCNSAGFYRRPSAEFTRDSAPDEAHLRTLNFSNLRAQSCPASPRMHGKPLSGGCEVRSSLKKNGARAVAAEMKERLRQTVHRDETEEVGYVKNLSPERPQGWFGDSEDITQEIAKSTRDQDSRKNNFILTKTFPTGKRVAIQRVDMEDATCTSGGEELSLPSAKMDKQNVTRSGISLPCSPHLGERTLDNVPVSSMRTRPKRASEQKPTIPRTTEQADSPATLIAVAKKTIASTESPRRINDSPRSSKSEFTEKSMRRSASVNENAIRSYHLQQKGDACPVPTSKGNCHDHSENDPALNFTRSRSVPNVAILRDRGQCTNEAKKGTAKTTSEVSKHGKGQNSEKRKGFFSVGRKKGRAPVESISSGHSLFFPSSGPVFARVAALAESCVSQGNTLSDADSAVNVTVHVRSRRSTDRSKKGREWPKEANASSELKNFVECFEPWFAHESDVISESSADSDANPNDEEFLDALSQLTPLIDQKSTAIEKQITGELLGTVSTITSQAHEVRNLALRIKKVLCKSLLQSFKTDAKLVVKRMV
uniref:DUF3741 domain-containing protein n=1 Tax=Physcomitrium patens TaxID=3218 RepID=A0A2K1J2M4_PHYPA|nr:hypothetical protein PHYPA_021628 [Physcomitrium patens]